MVHLAALVHGPYGAIAPASAKHVGRADSSVSGPGDHLRISGKHPGTGSDDRVAAIHLGHALLDGGVVRHHGDAAGPHARALAEESQTGRQEPAVDEVLDRIVRRAVATGRI